MKTTALILSVAFLGLISCKQLKKGEGDATYIIHLDKSGKTIKDGDFVSFNVIEKTEEDSLLYSSYDYDRPALMQKEKSVFKGDLYDAMAKLSEGDSATFKINIDSLVAKMGKKKPANTKGKYLLYTISVNKVIPKGKLSDSLFRSKIDAYLKAELGQVKGKEASKIRNYISSNNLKPKITASGLNYVVTKQGRGSKAKLGDTVLVNYTGMFLSGKIFDTRYPDVAKKIGSFNKERPYGPLKMAIGKGPISGFDEGLMLFPKGTKATLILPSKLAYGEQGNPAIPPQSPLIFEIEIVNIIPKKVVDKPRASVKLHRKK